MSHEIFKNASRYRIVIDGPFGIDACAYPAMTHAQAQELAQRVADSRPGVQVWLCEVKEFYQTLPSKDVTREHITFHKERELA